LHKEVLNMTARKIDVTLWREDEDGDEVETTYSLPARFEVCPECDGEGSTYLGWRNRDQPAFTSEDLAEDPDWAEDMFAGAYDRACPECKGERVVLVVDERRLSPADQEAWESYQEDQASEAYYDAIAEAERRFGC
jgi:hypothetical protein